MEIQDVKKVVEEVIVKALKEYVNPLFTAIQENFNKIDERFERLEQKIERIEHRLSSLERRAFAIEEILTEHQHELKSIKETLFVMKTNGEKDQRRFVDVDKRIIRLEEKVFA